MRVCRPRYVVLMPSAESSAAEFACLQTALHAICDEAPAADVSVTTDDPAAFAALAGALEAQPRRFTIREAVLAPQEMIPAAEAVGRICAAPAVSCPPAIPDRGQRRDGPAGGPPRLCPLWHREGGRYKTNVSLSY